MSLRFDMAFSIRLQNRDFEDIPLPPDLKVTVKRYGASAIGGPVAADIDITGPSEQLAEVIRWLRYGITIYSDEGTPVWWGYIQAFDIVAGALWDRVSLESMWNRVSITYSYNSASGAWQRDTTAQADDSESVARYGIKELTESLGDGELDTALARRTEILRVAGKPVALPIVEAGMPGVRLYCRGWWDTLGWKYFQRLEGRIENEGIGDEISLAFGWKLTNSTRVHFMGASTSYTRTISNARGIYTLTITGATNTTPIQITTSVPHERTYGEIVSISGVVGNTAANGTFKIKNITDTTFELVNASTDDEIAGNGAYSGGGTVTVTSNPIVITTSTPHAVKAGDVITISGVGGNTAANGTFTAARVTSTTFELNDQYTGDDVAGNGAYSGGGTMARVIEQNNTALVYGRKVTAASNATPIVITCTAHGFANGDVVRISGVEGNTAANGTFRIASVTTNTFSLTDQLTGANIAANGDYAIGGSVVLASDTGPFDALKSRQSLTVAGSTSNNGSFSAIRDGSDSGNTIDVSPAPTSEAAGASVTVTLRGEQVAQSFIGVSNFTANSVALKLGTHGAPSDSVIVELRNDSGGSVGATILASGSISYSELSQSPDWVWINFSSAVALSAGARYWIVISRSSSTSAYNHYLIQFDYSSYETTMLWTGSAWVAASGGMSMPFRVWATEDLLAQARAMLTAGNQFFVAQDASGSHGVSANQYRAGDRRVQAELESILATTGSNGSRLLATVTPQRVARIYAEPVSADDDPVLTRNLEVLTAAGHPWPRGVLPVGRWLQRDGLPAGTDIMIQRSIFIEEAVYDAVDGSLSQLRLRGSEEFFG